MNILNIFGKKAETMEIQQAPTQLPLKVLKPLDERPSIGKRNEKIIDSIFKVKEVAVQLSHAGFHILDIELNGRNPRIIINPCKRCELLDGAMIKISRLSRIVVRTYAAKIQDVQVEWMVPDHG